MPVIICVRYQSLLIGLVVAWRVLDTLYNTFDCRSFCVQCFLACCISNNKKKGLCFQNTKKAGECVTPNSQGLCDFLKAFKGTI